jgi:hypothetical protein
MVSAPCHIHAKNSSRADIYTVVKIRSRHLNSLTVRNIEGMVPWDPLRAAIGIRDSSLELL